MPGFKLQLRLQLTSDLGQGPHSPCLSVSSSAPPRDGRISILIHGKHLAVSGARLALDNTVFTEQWH